MKNITLIEGETFDPGYRDFGLLEFIRKVLLRTKDKRKHGLTGTITVEFGEFDRLYLYNESGEEFILSHEMKFSTNTRWGSAYTLWKRADVPTTVIELSDGYALSKFI
jgi:hypothetical protein